MTTHEPPSRIQAALSRLWLFEYLEAPELERLAQHARIQCYGANDVIFEKGDPGYGLMAVLEGLVKISTSSPDGKAVVLNIINPGELFGEIALLDGEDRSADANAMGPTEVLVIDQRDFVPFLGRHPEMCMKMIGVLCRRIRQTSEQLEDTLFLVQSARLAKRLLRLAREFGRPEGKGTTIDLHLSQREMGTLIGMTREAINRQLARWREEKLISFDEGVISIPDLEAFERFSEELIWHESE